MSALHYPRLMPPLRRYVIAERYAAAPDGDDDDEQASAR